MGAPSLVATNVTKVFGGHRSATGLRRGGGAVHAVGPLSLSVEPFEFLAIVGPSGCGKSTALRLFAGLLSLTGGTVVRSESILAPGAMSMVFQTPALLPWRSTLGNVMVAAQLIGMDKREARERAGWLLELVGLERFSSALPHQLSGGMQSRAAICRALMAEPKLLFMDEPFGALDAITREQLTWDLQRIWLQNQNSVVFVTHSVEESLLLADRVLVMTGRPGRVAAIVDNPLPRPRTPETMADPEFVARANSIRAQLARVMLEGTSDRPSPSRKSEVMA